MAFDPWAASNQALSNLGRTFDDMETQRQTRESFALEQRRQEMLNRALKLQTDKAEREASLESGLQSTLQNAQGERRFVPEVPPQQPLMAGGLVNLTPQNIGGSSMGGGYNVQEQPNLERAMLQYYQKNDPAKAQEYGKQMLDKFKTLAEADPEGAVQWYNSVSGMNLKVAGVDGDYIYTKTDDGEVLATNKKNPLDTQIVYEGRNKADIQGEILDKRFAQQEEMQRRQFAHSDAAQTRLLAAIASRQSGESSKPPAGYRWTSGGNLEAIPGGPGEAKINKEELSKQGSIDSIDTAIDSLNGLLKHPGRAAATGTSAILNKVAIPGTDRAGFLAKLDTFQSQMFVPMVSQLKGMGQLSDAEGKKLTQAVGALNPNMPEKELKASMNKIMAELRQKRARISGGRATASNDKTPPQGKQGGKKSGNYSDLLNKYRK